MKKFVKQAAGVAVLAASALALTSCGGKKADKTASADKHYTYHFVAANPKTWNPTDYENHDEAIPLDYSTSAFWYYIPNEDRKGYTIFPLFASAMPTDVTAEYASDPKWGIGDGETGKAWRITIRKNVTWDDGTPINVDDVEYSLQQYLNPEMKNFRASNYYESSWPLVNAKKYYQGTEAYDDVCVGSGEYRDVADSDMLVSLNQKVMFFGDTVSSYYSSNPDKFMDGDKDMYKALEALAGGKDYFALTADAKDMLYKISKNCGDNGANAYKEYCFTYTKLEPTEWSDVGYRKIDDYTFDIIMTQSMTEFFVTYHGSSGMLVKKDTYEANKQQMGNIVKTKYNTSAETSASYGPFKVDAFQADKYMHMTKNDKWFGWDLPELSHFMTTDLDIQYITDSETRMSLFLQGKLDTIDLTSAQTEQYGASEYALRLPESYTHKYSFNIDRKALQKEDGNGINHSILANKDFRHGVCLSLDRQKYVDTAAVGFEPGYALLNYLYMADPESGTLYRETPQAIKALTEYYGVTDEKDITGYDLVSAREYFNKAYNDELAAGYIKATDRFEFDFHVYAATSQYTGRVQFLQDSLNEATKGTPFEGKITVNLIGDQNFYDNMRNGNVDIAMTAWGGASMDPYGCLWCYVEPSAKHEYGTNPQKDTVTINIEGKDVTKTLYDWYVALCMEEYTTASFDVKNTILAECEKALLEYYNVAPMAYFTTVSLGSHRIIEYSDTYMNQFVAFGTLYFMEYSMDDAEWDAYCAENNNQLKY